MTIKEIEARSGLTRANIRFYEAEGLLSPQRRPNGYRDYSEEDLEDLKRIRLLRTLRLSLEEIKAIHAGERTLSDALDSHLERLEWEKAELQRSKAVCLVMRGDGVSYDTLDAQRYLDELELAAKGPPVALSGDAMPRVQAPWRRFFARSLDGGIYTLLWMAFWGLVMNVNFLDRGLLGDCLDFLMVLVLNLLLEPLFLSRLGTTPGKWIMGLRVTDYEDGRLTYEEAMTRTKKVLWRGVGLNLPVVNVVCVWTSRDACLRGETLYWEEESLLVLRDERKGRFALWGAACLVIAGLQLLFAQLALLPPNRGDLTVAEFAENYNSYAAFYAVDTNRALTPEGTWEEKQDPYDHVTIAFQDGDTVPHFQFQEEEEIVTGVSFTIDVKNRRAVLSYQDEMKLAAMAFLMAQPGSTFSREIHAITDYIEENPFTDFSFTVCGVNLVCEVTHSGYLDDSAGGLLWSADGADTAFWLSFSMEKEEK